MLMILLQISLIFMFTWIGELVISFTHLPIPGSVIGMILLFLGLQSGAIKLDWVEAGATLLISEMMLFFIPAVVGFIQYSWLFSITGLLILFIIVSGTVIMMITTSVISDKILGRQGGEIRKWLPRYFI